MKIILIGFMGSGKTKIAKTLAESLSLPVLEMDDVIVQKSGKSSVAEIFALEGEIRFRELEMKVCKYVGQQNNVIVSSGGGVVMNQLNMDYMKKNRSIVIYLNTPWEIILERCDDSTKRPLMRDKIKAKQLYRLRQPLYRFYADIMIDRKRQTINETVQQILLKLTHV